MSPHLPRTLFVAAAGQATGWYRCSLPAMALGADWVGAGGEPPELQFPTGVTRGPVTLAGLEDYDVVVLQQPAGRGWLKLIRRLQAAGVRVLFEIDDYVHALRKAADHDFASSFGKDVIQGYELGMRAADGIICSTDFIARRYRAFNKRVWVCRNGLDLRRYALTKPERPLVGIGWAGATGHRDAVRPWLAAVAEVMREEARTRFVTVGQPFAAELAEEFGPERGLDVPFSPLDTYPASMTHYDVALGPAGRSAFYRGKSDLRWLEASALGTPLVADPTVYPEIEHGVTGFHASTPAEVREQLLALVRDPALRRRVGEAARAHVREHRSIEAMAPQWARALTEVVALDAGERAA